MRTLPKQHKPHVMVQMGARARAADQAEAAATGVPLWTRQRREQFVPDEIGVLLGCTKMAATVRYGTACQAADLPVVAQAWRSGQVDARKVATICEQLSHLEHRRSAEAHSLAADAVGYATEPGRSRTGPQLREWLRRRVIAANPEAAEARRQRAMGDRRVVITPTDDGMSELWALLPAVQARQIQQTLTTTAQQLGAEDARSMDQRRADTLVDLLLGRTEPATVDVQVIVPADTLTGPVLGTEPGWVPGLGPVTAGQVTELLGSEPSAGAVLEPADGAGRRIEGGVPAVGDRPGHRGPDRPGRGPVPPVSGVGPGGPGQGCDLPVPRLPPCRRQCRHRPGPHHPLPRRPHRSDQPGGALPTAPPPQAHRRLDRHPPPHRGHDLDHPHRPHLQHRPWHYTNPEHERDPDPPPLE